jgi:hypothetical protein
MSPRSLTNWTKHSNKLWGQIPLRRIARRTKLPLRLELLEDKTLLSTAGWITEFGTAGNDSAQAVTQDASGGIYVAGVTNESGIIPSRVYFLPGGWPGTGADSFVRKYDASGNLFWTQQFGLGQDNQALGIAANTSGEYVVGTTSAALPGQTLTGNQDAYIRKYDPNGALLWTHEFGTPGSQAVAYSVAVNSSGVFVVGQNGFYGFVSMYSADGTEVWTQQLGSPSTLYYTYNVAADASSVYVGGAHDISSNGQSFDAFVNKYDLSGNQLWTRQIGSGGVGGGFGLAVDATGVYAGAFTADTLPGQTSITTSGGLPAVRPYLQKFDAAGNVLWTQEYGQVSDETPLVANIVVDSSGIYVAAGGGPGHGFVAKYDLTGNEVWTLLGYGTDTSGSHVVRDFQGYGISAGPSGIFVTGTTADSAPGYTNAGGYDAILGKLSVAPVASFDNLPAGNTAPEGSSVNVSAVASHLIGTLPLNTPDELTWTWTVTKDGVSFPFRTNSGGIGFDPLDEGSYVVSVSAVDPDGTTGPFASTTITVTDVPPTVYIGGNNLLYVGNLLSFGANISDSPAENQAGFSYAWSIAQGSPPYVLPPGTNTSSPSFSFTPTDAGDYTVNVAVTNSEGDVTTATQTVTVATIDATSFQNSFNSLERELDDSAYVTLQTIPSQLGAATNVLNALVDENAVFDIVYGVTLNLTSGNYQDVNLNLQPGVTVTINGVNGSTTIVGHSPALTVAAGSVTVNNVAFTTATDAPTILVAGGSLALRNDVVQSSTAFSDPAIADTGGTVDLGSTLDPGNNTINVNGNGQLVLNTTSTPVSSAGNTFESNGTVLPGSDFSFTSLSAASASVIPVQPVTFTATVVVPAGGSGTPTGKVDFVDSTSNADLGTAPVSGGVAQLTAPLSALGTHVIIANYLGDGTFLPSLASVSQNVTQSLYVLDATASGALSVSGSASINLSGNLIVDSSSKSALAESGNAKITAASIQVVGGVSKSGNATLNPAANTGATASADPLAALSGPSASGLTNYGSASYSKGSYPLKPGIYSQISASGTASLSLSPGLYLIEGGGFTITGGASVSGSGVTIYNTVSTYPKAGGNYGGITLSGSGTFSLTAATTATAGAYPGILVDQPRANTRALSLAGNGVAGLNGTIYAPTAQVTVSGNAQLNGALVVDRLSLSGNGVSTQVADGSAGSILDTAGAGTLLAGNLTVYVNDSSGYFTADELSRIQDAITTWDTLLAPYSVTISEVPDPSHANVIIDDGTTSAAGSAADGVLGSYSSTGEITILQGWNWYAGADATQIGGDQFDFQTVITHELGHALGLGGSPDSTSPMHETLATATVRRAARAADLNIPDPPAGADPERAAGFNASQVFGSAAQNNASPAPTAVSSSITIGLPALPPGGSSGPWADGWKGSVPTDQSAATRSVGQPGLDPALVGQELVGRSERAQIPSIGRSWQVPERSLDGGEQGAKPSERSEADPAVRSERPATAHAADRQHKPVFIPSSPDSYRMIDLALKELVSEQLVPQAVPGEGLDAIPAIPSDLLTVPLLGSRIEDDSSASPPADHLLAAALCGLGALILTAKSLGERSSDRSEPREGESFASVPAQTL